MTAKGAGSPGIKHIDPSLIFDRFLVVAKHSIRPERDCLKHGLIYFSFVTLCDDWIRRRPNNPDLAKSLLEPCKDVNNLYSNRKELIDPPPPPITFWMLELLCMEFSGKLEAAFQLYLISACFLMKRSPSPYSYS